MSVWTWLPGTHLSWAAVAGSWPPPSASGHPGHRRIISWLYEDFFGPFRSYKNEITFACSTITCNLMKVDCWGCNFAFGCVFLSTTGCPRSNLAERIGYNFTRVDFWPHVDKVKMCFRNIHFFWKIFDFWKIVNIKYLNWEMCINFQPSIMVYWIEHWIDILEVPGLNPSAA